jgi:hypothetical protein
MFIENNAFEHTHRLPFYCFYFFGASLILFNLIVENTPFFKFIRLRLNTLQRLDLSSSASLAAGRKTSANSSLIPRGLSKIPVYRVCGELHWHIIYRLKADNF